MKNHVLSILVLLMVAVTGAWAQDAKHLITATYDKQTRSLEQPLPYATTVGELYEAVTGESFNDLISRMSALEMTLSGIGSTNTDVVSIGELNGASTPVTVNADGKAAVALRFGSYAQGIFVTVTIAAAANYTVTLKEGTDDATSWQGKAGEGEYQALPLEGVAAGTALSVKYNGTKKVKSVKAVKKAMAPAEPTPAVGQVIGSDGKNYDYDSLPVGVTAVAKICYVSDGHGLALALADESSSKMTWNTAKSTCSGKTPAVTGCTWKLATKDEWNNMINAAGGFSALRDGFSSVGGTNMLSGSNDYYWSSTTTGYDCAWSCTFSTGNWTDDYADDYTTDYVRACLAW